MDEKEKESVLEQLMVEHGTELVRLAFQYVKDRDTAKDIVQNTYVKCYEKLDTFRFEASLKTWLYSITINGCKDYLKSWHYRKTKASEFVYDTARSLLPSTEEHVVQEHTNQELKAAVFSLPQMYREVIYLYYYESLKVEEVATLLGEKTTTVKTRLRRGKQKLKKRLEVVGLESEKG